MSWEQAVKNLFQSHPRSISSKSVIEAIKFDLPEIVNESNTENQFELGQKTAREDIAYQLKALPAEALFYPANILKLLKLD